MFRPADWRNQSWGGPEWHELEDGRMVLPDPRVDRIFAAPNNGVFLRRKPLPRLSGGETILSIRAYAHDRLVFTAAPISLGPGPRKRTKRRRLASRGRNDRVLERRRETQEKTARRGGHGRIPAATKFTRHGSTMVRDAGHLIERDKTGQAVFLTLTIAGGGQDVYDAISSFSGFIVNRFGTWLRGHAELDWFTYVWELQTRGAPHLHYMLSLPKGLSIRSFRKMVQAEWRRILCDVSVKSGVDVFKTLDGRTWKLDKNAPYVGAKLCTHDLGRYMAKYVSKSRSKNGLATTWYPGRWWAVSYALRKAIMKERVKVKIRFPSIAAARAALSQLISAASEKTHAPYMVPAEKTFGAVVVSVDTWVGQAKPIAYALRMLLDTGEISAVLQKDVSNKVAA